jgi:hypothetical protein
VLASSQKINGRCIAGIDLESGDWLRPVSATQDGGLREPDCAVEGRYPEPFDVVRVQLDHAAPQPWQPENWVIGDTEWSLRETANPEKIWKDLRDQVDHHVDILADHSRTVSAESVRKNPVDASLVLVEPTELHWRLEKFGSRQHKADFSLGDRGMYEFMVTDIPIKAALGALPDGVHDRSKVGIGNDEEVLLTISFSEPWSKTDTCSKLVAAVLHTSLTSTAPAAKPTPS